MVAGEKGYSATELRAWLEAREIAAVIPTRDTETDQAYGREAERERLLGQRPLNRLKGYRRIATRCEQLTSSYLAMVTIACILE